MAERSRGCGRRGRQSLRPRQERRGAAQMGRRQEEARSRRSGRRRPNWRPRRKRPRRPRPSAARPRSGDKPRAARNRAGPPPRHPKSLTQSAEELHRSRKPHHENQGRLHPGLQCAGGGRRDGAGDRRPRPRREAERSTSIGADGRRHRSQSGQSSSRRNCRRTRAIAPTPTLQRWRNARSTPISRRGGPSTPGKEKAAAPASPPCAKKFKAGGHSSPYRLRKQLPEPVFGQIKQARGFRQFLLRGLDQGPPEFTLVALTHNLLKLWRAQAAA